MGSYTPLALIIAMISGAASFGTPTDSQCNLCPPQDAYGICPNVNSDQCGDHPLCEMCGDGTRGNGECRVKCTCNDLTGPDLADQDATNVIMQACSEGAVVTEWGPPDVSETSTLLCKCDAD